MKWQRKFGRRRVCGRGEPGNSTAKSTVWTRNLCAGQEGSDHLAAVVSHTPERNHRPENLPRAQEGGKDVSVLCHKNTSQDRLPAFWGDLPFL